MYFLIWWATVGATLVLNSTNFGLAGFIIFAIVHWLCDFVWLWILSAVSYKGGEIFGRLFQKIVFLICGVLLILFSIRFFYDAVKPFIV